MQAEEEAEDYILHVEAQLKRRLIRHITVAFHKFKRAR